MSVLAFLAAIFRRLLLWYSQYFSDAGEDEELLGEKERLQESLNNEEAELRTEGEGKVTFLELEAVGDSCEDSVELTEALCDSSEIEELEELAEGEEEEDDFSFLFFALALSLN